MVGLSLRNELFVVLGIMGMIFNIYAQLVPDAFYFYVAGDFCLLLTAVHFKFLFFICLEIVHLVGGFSYLLIIDPHLQAVLPIFIAIQVIIYYALSGKLLKPWLWFGLLGMSLRALEFGFNYPFLNFTSSILIAAYAFYRIPYSKGISLCWAIPNSVGVCIALYQYIILFFNHQKAKA